MAALDIAYTPAAFAHYHKIWLYELTHARKADETRETHFINNLTLLMDGAKSTSIEKEFALYQ